jgi:hypothetical protein
VFREFRTRLDTINESHDSIIQRVSSVLRVVRYRCENAECESRSGSERDYTAWWIERKRKRMKYTTEEERKEKEEARVGRNTNAQDGIDGAEGCWSGQIAEEHLGHGPRASGAGTLALVTSLGM